MICVGDSLNKNLVINHLIWLLINGSRFICFRLTVQNVEQAGTVPAKILDPVSSEIFATHATSIEIPCVGVGLPTPEYT